MATVGHIDNSVCNKDINHIQGGSALTLLLHSQLNKKCGNKTKRTVYRGQKRSRRCEKNIDNKMN